MLGKSKFLPQLNRHWSWLWRNILSNNKPPSVNCLLKADHVTAKNKSASRFSHISQIPLICALLLVKKIYFCT